VRHVLAALALLSSFSAVPAGAAPEVYGVRLPREGLAVEVPYTLGTHHEYVTGVDGTVRVDPETFRLEGGRLVIPLAYFHSDNATRGCHLREALGLDYARSRFPREHVCDDRNQLPASGPDAIAFPEIVLQLSRGGPAAAASPGAAAEVELEGTLAVHGVTRPVRLHLAATRDASSPVTLRVRGRVPLRLADFGVQVKPAKVFLFSIAVRDEVTVVVDTLMEPVARR
jgi:polyisoprenoid-binding protein YceI